MIQARAFTKQETRARLKDMRSIAASVVKNYATDLEYDESALHGAPHVPAWLWVPEVDGTHLSRITPNNKLLIFGTIDYLWDRITESVIPFLVTPESVAPSSFTEIVALVEETPDPAYQVIDHKGVELLRTASFADATTVFNGTRTAVILAEVHEPEPLQEKEPIISPYAP